MNRFIKSLLLVVFLFCGTYSYSQDKSSTVEFILNTDRFIQNDKYESFINDFVPYVQSNSEQIENILIVGSASPEGSLKNNIRLAKSRANRIYTYIQDYIPRNKFLIVNDYDLYLEKTGLDETDYNKLRASYIEVHLKKIIIPQIQTDTIYVEKRDTLYKETEIINNYYYNTEKVIDGIHVKPVFAVYNSLTSDLLLRPNIGAEVYFKKMSFFVEGSFSKWDLFGKTYNIDVWYSGFRKYFNYDYDKWFIEAFADVAYFDTNLFWKNGKVGIIYGGGLGVGYVFNLCPHWKIYPVIRFGLFERIYYSDYYYSGQGSINISFGNYSNGILDNTSSGQNGSTNTNVIEADKQISKEFINNSNKAFYIGPTYVGIVLKRDFCIKTKNKKK